MFTEHSIFYHWLKIFWTQDSPPAWPQEAYRPRPPPPKVSKILSIFCPKFCPLFWSNLGRGAPQTLTRTLTWGARRTLTGPPWTLTRPPDLDLGGPPRPGPWPGRPPDLDLGGPQTLTLWTGRPPTLDRAPPDLDTLDRGGALWTGGPTQTHKVKTLPSRHTPYAGGKNSPPAWPQEVHRPLHNIPWTQQSDGGYRGRVGGMGQVGDKGQGGVAYPIFRNNCTAEMNMTPMV